MASKPSLRAFYRPHPRVTQDNVGPSMTKQSHKQECDINTILRTYQRTGIITHVQAARPTYTDLPSDFDFQESINTIMLAEQAFDALPAVVRRHFDNSPQKFLEAFADPAQEKHLREFGLLRAADDVVSGTATPPPGAPSGAP